jgi:signal transduction histidine kinase
MHWWYVGAVANAVIVVAFVAISASIARALARADHWRRNPLAVATAAIFFAVGVHHGLLEAHPRHALDEWQVAGWDLVVAAVGVWYWTLRSRFPALVRGAAVFEDLKQRQKQALEMHDDLVQTLASAKLSLELAKPEDGLDAVERMLSASRRTMTNLLGEEGAENELGPGDLRRETAAGGA